VAVGGGSSSSSSSNIDPDDECGAGDEGGLGNGDIIPGDGADDVDDDDVVGDSPIRVVEDVACAACININSPNGMPPSPPPLLPPL